MTLANRITLGRILLIPAFVTALLYYQESGKDGVYDDIWRYLALGIFSLAAISDGIDGYLARHCNQRSELGAILDPIADKLLLLASLITLSLIHADGLPSFPLWFPITIISRDAILLGGVILLHYGVGKVHVRPHWTGKGSTFFQLIAVGAILLEWPIFIWACYIAGITAVISTILYLRDGWTQAKHHGIGQASISTKAQK